MKELTKLSDLLGLEVVSIEGGKVGDDEVMFTFSDGNIVKMFHEQDCCEIVDINDVDGDIQDLVGGIVVQFDESSSEYDCDKNADLDAALGDMDYVQSATWTFYNIATTKGFVSIGWLGESNGYYSESVTVSKSPFGYRDGLE